MTLKLLALVDLLQQVKIPDILVMTTVMYIMYVKAPFPYS